MNKGLDAIDKINLRLEKLKEYVTILQTLKGITADELRNNVDKRAKAERFLHLASEACIDIAELIIIDQRLRTPDNAREAFEILGEKKILQPKLQNSLLLLPVSVIY